MRFLTWNIRFGGIGPAGYRYDPATSGKNVRAIAKCLLAQDADVIVLSEYRDFPETGEVIKSLLETGGYLSYVSNPGMDKNGILMSFSDSVRERFDIHVSDRFVIDLARIDEIFRYRWLNLRLVGVAGGESLDILGVHIPDVSRGGGEALFRRTLGYKKLFWQALIRYAKEAAGNGDHSVIIGDFNTGLDDVDKAPGGEGFYLGECIQALKAVADASGRHKWTDAWRKFHFKPSYVDYTWYTPEGVGYRLDYAFVSPSLADRLVNARRSDDERKRRLSDHSMLIADLDI